MINSTSGAAMTGIAGMCIRSSSFGNKKKWIMGGGGMKETVWGYYASWQEDDTRPLPYPLTRLPCPFTFHLICKKSDS